MRNKKQPIATTTPEQLEVEKHVEEIMNPEVAATPEVVRTEEAVSAPGVSSPIDIFQGLPADKIPLGAPKTAPEVPGKGGKSLFSSVADLNRPPAVPQPTLSLAPAPMRTPITVSHADEPPAKTLAKTATLGDATVASATAVSVDRLARREEYADAATDSAVAEIMASEGDDLLAAEDVVRLRPISPVAKQPGRGDRWRMRLTSRWLLLGIPLILIMLAAVPFTRNKLASLVIKQTLTVTVIDSKTSKPVSGAELVFGSVRARTDGVGQATLKVPYGDGTLSIAKKYYASYSHKESFTIGQAVAPLRISLDATGRQVPLTILNSITRKPLSGVMVSLSGTSAVSDSKGKISIVLPTKAASLTAKLTAPGFNVLTAPVQVTDAVVAANTLSLVPAGNVYFISGAGGTLDVIKSDLDGSNRQTILAGTGKEDPANTSLVASRDWHYVAVRSRRDGTQTALSMIDTSTNKVTQFDTSAATYTPIGWSGHTLLYDVLKPSQNPSQAGRESLKAYNADQQQLNQLDQSQVVGSGSKYAYQSYGNFFVMDAQLVYSVHWNPSDPTYDLTAQSDSIRSISASGQGKKDLQQYAASVGSSVQAAHVLPGTINYAITDGTDKTSYYSYSNNTVMSDTNVSAATFNKTYPVYLPSPDGGSKTLWSEPKGSRLTLLLGDRTAGTPNPLIANGEYSAYGWYGTQYLLLSRGGSGLYIIPASGIPSDSAPLKIANYSQPAQSAAAYGGGY